MSSGDVELSVQNPMQGGTSKPASKRAKKNWGKVKAAVKVGTYHKMAKHKKKIAAAVTLKIIIIVVINIVLVAIILHGDGNGRAGRGSLGSVS